LRSLIRAGFAAALARQRAREEGGQFAPWASPRQVGTLGAPRLKAKAGRACLSVIWRLLPWRTAGVRLDAVYRAGVAIMSRFAWSALALLVASQAACADDAICKPKLYAQLDMITEPDGAIAAVAGLNGTQHRLLVDTGSLHSFLSMDFVKGAGMATKTIDRHLTIHTSMGDARYYVKVDQFTLGNAGSKDSKFVIMAGNFRPDPQVVGSIGTDILANFNVEFDPAAGKINLLSGCPGIGAYWAARYAELPIDVKKLGRPSSAWQLDGQPVTVTFSTTDSDSSMPFNVAHDKFGLDEKSPGIEQTGTRPDGDPLYTYRFKQLTAEGITISNPLVRLHGSPDDSPCDGRERTRLRAHGRTIEKCLGKGDLMLGMRDLSKLHLMFAFQEGKLYFTAADAH
jgi:hypothetical protein